MSSHPQKTPSTTEPKVPRTSPPGNTEGSHRHRETAEELWLEALAAGTPVQIAVRGSCMEPLLLDGDRVRVAPLRTPAVVGLLVLARDTGGQLVCHRVLAQEGSRLSLAGDRSYRVEQHDASTLYGQVMAAERSGGHLELRPRPRVDAFMARWHHAAWRRRGTWIGRLLEAPRWRLVALRARLRWRRVS